MAQKIYHINGSVIDSKNKRGIAGLRVEAWDKELIFDDPVGSTFTGQRGAFRMVFDETAFKELFLDRRPDLFFKVFKSNKLIKNTKDSVIWNVQREKTKIVIEVDISTKPAKSPVYPDPDSWPEPDPEKGKVPEERYYPPKPGKWNEQLNEWWKKRQKEREPRKPGPVPMPRPYLDCTSNFIPQIVPLIVDEPGRVSFTIWNDGNFPTWTCYVQIYEGPEGYTHPLSDYKLRGQTIITLQPGERREVTLPWVRSQHTGRIVGICFDPLLDPKNFTLVEHYNRHITSVHYLNLR